MARRARTIKSPNELDLAIIKQLQIDARKPFTTIAQELGLPESTVRKRVDRLESNGIVRFTAFADPLRLGFQYWSLINIKVELHALERTAEAVAKNPEIFFVGITTGEYNLFIAGVFKSNADLLNFLNTRLPKGQDIIETTTSNVMRIFKRTGHIFPNRSSTPPRMRAPRMDFDEEYEISPVDLKIIAVLQAEGRKSFAQVASQVGIAESTVHNRVTRLTKLGILQFEAYADPLRIGYQHWTLLWFRIESRKPLFVATELTQFPELFFVGATTGTSDLFAAGVFPSNEDLLAFLTKKIGSLKSILSVSTVDVLRLVKRQLVYPLTIESETGYK